MRTFVLLGLTLAATTPAHAITGPFAVAPTCTSVAGVSDEERNCNADSLVYLPSGAPSTWEDRLVVILPGTDMEPNKHDELARMSATFGFRTLALSYDNRHKPKNGGSGKSISSLCEDIYGAGAGIETCHEAVADAILWGKDASTPADLDMEDEDTVILRLMDALDQLYVQDLMDGVNDYSWDQYYLNLVTNGSWCDFIIVGFSQGSTVTGVLASQEDLGAAVFLDGPSGWVDLGGVKTAQSWRAGPHATSGGAMFGAYHKAKAQPPLSTWTDLGMPGGIHEVDSVGTSVLPAGIHRIRAKLPWPASCSSHYSMARDTCFDYDPATSAPVLMGAYRGIFRDAAAAMDPQCVP